MNFGYGKMVDKEGKVMSLIKVLSCSSLSQWELSTMTPPGEDIGSSLLELIRNGNELIMQNERDKIIVN
jgi:hypothetical protein